MAMRVLKLQWPYVKAHVAYEAAYRAGVEKLRYHYGEPMIWQIMPTMRRGDALQSLRLAGLAMRYYPQGVIKLARAKAKKVFRLLPSHG